MATFTVYIGREEVGEHFFDDGPILIGRAEQCDLRIKLPTVSRKHAIVRRHGRNWSISEDGGRNGLFVNGQCVNFKMLDSGDRIRISRATIIFQESDDQRRARDNKKAGRRGAEHYISMDRVEHMLKEGQRPDHRTRRKPPGVNSISFSADGTMVMTPLQQQKEAGIMEKQLGAHLAWFDGNGNKQLLPIDGRIEIGRGKQMHVRVSGLWALTPLFAVLEHDTRAKRFSIVRNARFIRMKVNGEPLGKEPRRLEDGDRMSISGATIRFHDVALRS